MWRSQIELIRTSTAHCITSLLPLFRRTTLLPLFLSISPLYTPMGATVSSFWASLPCGADFYPLTPEAWHVALNGFQYFPLVSSSYPPLPPDALPRSIIPQILS